MRRTNRGTDRESLARATVGLLGSLAMTPLAAQQVTIGTPYTNAGTGFYERIGVDFGFSGPGFFYNQNFSGAALPPFGGYTPGGGATFGFGGSRGPYSYGFGLTMDQGADSTFSSTTPMLTIPNGGSGAIFSGTQTPFVTGVVPVVGAGGGTTFAPAATSAADRIGRYQMGERGDAPVAIRRNGATADDASAGPASLSLRPTATTMPGGSSTASPARSTAEQGAVSLDEILAARAAEATRDRATADADVTRLIDDAAAALERGRAAAAASYLRQASRRAEEPLKSRLLERAATLDAAAKGR